MRRPFPRPLVYYYAVAVVFMVLVLAIPPNHAAEAAYHLSAFQYRLLIGLVILPLLLIWFVAFRGHTHLQAYASVIRQTPEGAAFQHVATGSAWLAWGLVLPVFISFVFGAAANSHPGVSTAGAIIADYLSLLMALIAYTIFSNGSRALAEQSGVRIGNRSTKLLVLLFVVFGVLFCLLVFRHIDIAHLGRTDHLYQLPGWLVIFTLVMPYLYAWFIGVLAAYELYLIGRQTTGVIYRRALQLVAGGLGTVIVGTSGYQYVRALTPRAGHLSLGFALVLVYATLAFAAMGYFLISLGASKLKRLEEV